MFRSSYSDGRNLKPMPVRPMVGRFLRLCRIGYPDWMIPKMIGLAALIGVQTLVEDYTFQLQGSMLGALMAMDRAVMLRLVCKATVAALAQGVIWESMLFIQREAGADMAQKIENNLFDRYCANNNFYIMSQLDGRIKDGEHRITDDIHGLFHWALSDVIIGGLRPLSKLLWFTYRIGGILGFRWPIGIWGYMLFSVFCLKQVSAQPRPPRPVSLRTTERSCVQCATVCPGDARLRLPQQGGQPSRRAVQVRPRAREDLCGVHRLLRWR